MTQDDLFDSGPLARGARLDLAPLPDYVADLAARLPHTLRLGTMSWTYPGWIGPLYAEGTRARRLANEGLAAYAKHPLLRTVELDRTFYAPLPAETYARFASQTPENFRFVAKAHEACTAVKFPRQPRYGARAGQKNPRLLDAAYASEQVVGPFVEGLGGKAGILLFQFSPLEARSPDRFAEKLHEFLARLPKGPTYAVELRNPELLTEAYGAALADMGAIHCHNAWEGMPDVLEQRAQLPSATRRILLARWLTRPGDTHERARKRYLPFDRLVEEDLPRRNALSRLTSEALREGAEAFVLVSNKAEGCAPESVRRLAEAISQSDGLRVTSGRSGPGTTGKTLDP